MKALCIMPNIDGIEDIVKDIENCIDGTVELRTNYMQAKKVVQQYDVLIVHQLVSPKSALEPNDFDELTDINPNAMLIPLINVKKGDDFVKKLFALGLFDSLYINESDYDSIAYKIKNKRTRNEAKEYYGITASDFNAIDDAIIADAVLNRTIDFLKTSKDRLDEVFESTSQSFNKRQMLYLIEHLPEEVSEGLKSNELYISFIKTLKRLDTQESKTIIIEKTKTEIQEVERTEVIKSNDMRRKLFTVVGNSEFCAEIAYITAKHTREDVLLIDLDVFTPEIHHVLGMKETVNSDIMVKNSYSVSSFAQAYEVATTLQLNYDLLRGIAVKHKADNFHVLTGNDVIQKGESFNVKPLEHILEVAQNTYSIIFVNIPFDFYKALNLYMVINPKATLLIPFNGGGIDLLNKKRMIKFVSDINNLKLRNIKYVAYEYNPKLHLEEKEMKDMTDGQYIGSIQQDKSRTKSRNDLRDSSVHKMNRNLEDEYRKILTRLGIKIKVKLSERFGRIFRR